MNILGFNIGQNYKGILNLGSTINTPLSATLQSVTDGTGVASPLQLSTTQAQVSGASNAPSVSEGIFRVLGSATNALVFGTTSSSPFGAYIQAGGSARYPLLLNPLQNAGSGISIGKTTNGAALDVRGDGTNPIARFESTSGSYALLINSLGDTLYGSGNFINIRGSLAGGGGVAVSLGSFNSLNATSGTQWVAETIGTFTGNAGNGNKYLHNFAYTINNAGAQTGTLTGILLNATETALNGMGHNLIDLQVGGSSRFRVDNGGALFVNFLNIANDIRLVGNIRLSSTGDGILNLFNNLSNNFNRLNFGGTTNAFPALKRNGAALEVRLADDSGFAGLSALSTTNTTYIRNGSYGLFGSISAPNASAILQADSTTQGFLPPRMTEAQRLAIAGGTPAIGLMVYQTDGTDGLYVYKAGGWQFIA